ncbi:MAG: hypothetical protein ACI4QN_00105 [Candidatus Coproplasma sp.]
MNKDIINNADVVEFYNLDAVKKSDCGDRVQNAINLSYRDLQRTLRSFSKCPKKESIKTQISVLIRREYEKLFLSDMDKQGFDKWHFLLCLQMKYIFKDVYKFTYGQAQKWVNMFCKYMYLYDDRMNSVLPFLHIPIDNIILNGIDKHSCYFSLQKFVALCRPWSKLDNYDIYLEFQNECRRIFGKPILQEFYLWNKWRNNNFKRFEKLTEFIDYFADTNQEFYTLSSPKEEMVDGQVGTLIPCLVYSTECKNFLSVLSQFTVINYKEVLDKQDLKYGDIQCIDFKNQDDVTILAFLTAIMRSMYFGNDCDLGEFAKSQIIYKMLCRLQELDI